jgi:hypothetical protein
MKYIFIFFFTLSLSSQSLVGTNGIFKSPSAYIQSDGSAYFGISLLPKGSYELYNTGDQFVGMPSFFTLSLFERVEFMFRYTHQLGQKVNPETRYFPDRMFALRYMLIKESVSFPVITLGFQDISEALGGSTAEPWFISTYIVASKDISFKSLGFVPSLGYGYHLFNTSREPIFSQFFGGLEIFALALPNFHVFAEFDSQTFNYGIKSTIADRISVAIGLVDGKSFSGFITYHIDLTR